MTQFSLPNWQPAKCKHVQKREEFYGDDLVDAMTIHCCIEFTNDRLDEWFPGLRTSLYQLTDTLTINGVPETTPDKRTELIEMPHKLKTECLGYMFSMRRGAGQSNRMKIELAGAEARHFLLDARQGGVCTLHFKVSVANLDEVSIGRIGVMAGREVEIMFIPPKLQDGTMPDDHAPAKRGRAKATSGNQMSIVGGTDTNQAPPPPQEKPDADGSVNPFKHTISNEELIDNNPSDVDATSVFLSNEGVDFEVPDEPSSDDDVDFTGLDSDLPPADEPGKTSPKKRPSK